MALAKPTFYFVLILIVGIISFSIMNLGTHFANDSSITLDNSSKEYIEQYQGWYETNRLTNLSDTNLEELKEDSLIIENNETGEQSSSDFFATVNWYKNKVNKIIIYFKLIYNFPSFIVLSLGLPIENFRHYINILGIILFAGLLYTLIKMVRGG